MEGTLLFFSMLFSLFVASVPGWLFFVAVVVSITAFYGTKELPSFRSQLSCN